MPDKRVLCHQCGRDHTFDGNVPRSATCDGCSANLRCCRTCRFYDPSAYNECAEPSAERVVDKLAATFCDYFDPRTGVVAGTSTPKTADAMSELERLFGKK